MVLGRSQDLACYTSVEVLDLERHEQVYFEHTLLPYQTAVQTAVGIVALMPRWLDYARNRHPTFARYLLLQQRLPSPELKQFGEGSSRSYWADPTAPRVKGLPLGLWFHAFVGDDHETINLA